MQRRQSKVTQAAGRGLHGVHLQGGHPVGEIVAADILAADPQGSLGQIAQGHPAVRHLAGHRQAHAAGPGTKVQHTASRIRPQKGQGAVHQSLRVCAGNEHLTVDVQGQAVKLPLADEIGHRLPGQVPLHQAADLLLHHRGYIELSVPQELLAGLAGSKAHQLPGLQGGGSYSGQPELLANIHIQIVICNGHNTTCCHFLWKFGIF